MDSDDGAMAFEWRSYLRDALSSYLVVRASG